MYSVVKTEKRGEYQERKRIRSTACIISRSAIRPPQHFAFDRPEVMNDAAKSPANKLTTSPSVTSLDDFYCIECLFSKHNVSNRKSILAKDMALLITDSGMSINDKRIIGDLQGFIEDPDRLIHFDDLLILTQNNTLIQRALSGQLVIQDFVSTSKVFDEIFASTVNEVHQLNKSSAGEVCHRIPKLLDANPDTFAASFCSVDGQRWSAGSSFETFTVQEMCGPMNYCTAMELHGADMVHKYIGMEPSGGSCREIMLDAKGRPHNPLVDAGLIMTSAIVKQGEHVADRFDFIKSMWEKACGTATSSFSNSTYLSHREHANSAYCLAYLMKESNAFPKKSPNEKVDIEKVLDFFFMNSSIETTCHTLSVFAGMLANGGVCPVTNEKCFDVEHIKNCLSVLSSAGLNDFSGTGQFLIDFPCKSSSSGILMMVIPNLGGFVTYSPRIDSFDISVFGLAFVKSVSAKFHLTSSSVFRDLAVYRKLFNSTPRKKWEDNPIESNTNSELPNEVNQLYYSAYHGNASNIRKLYARGVDVNEPDYDGRTALHLAVCGSSLLCVKVLVMLGANLKAVDFHGNTPITDARNSGFQSIIEYLETCEMSQRGVFDEVSSPVDIEHRTEERHDRISRYCRSLALIRTDGSWGSATYNELHASIRKDGIMLTLEDLISNVSYSVNPTDPVSHETLQQIITRYPAVSKVIEGQTRITDFKSFCDDVVDIFEQTKSNREGRIATYIPQLARVDPEKYGVAVCSVDGQQFSVGDNTEEFCVQSCSKPITYCIAQQLCGEKHVHDYVGYEPSGRNFNELLLSSTGKPHNPCVNSGAIVTASLVLPDASPERRFDYVTSVWTKLSGGRVPGYSNATFLSELSTADRNFCLGYLMKEKFCFPKHIDSSDALVDVLRFYFQICSLTFDCESLSVIAATLANGGVCPLTNERVFEDQIVRNALVIMSSSGMYDYSGEFKFMIGLPAKSGVAGALLTVIPGICGICTWSPRLDKHGNSVRGIEFFKMLEKRYSIHRYADTCALSKKKNLDSHSLYTVENKKCHLFLKAAFNGDRKTLMLLLSEGMDVNIRDYDKRTAIHVAASAGKLKSVFYLVMTYGAFLNPVDRWGQTPLSNAKTFGHQKVVDFLISKGGLEEITPETEI